MEPFSEEAKYQAAVKAWELKRTGGDLFPGPYPQRSAQLLASTQAQASGNQEAPQSIGSNSFEVFLTPQDRQRAIEKRTGDEVLRRRRAIQKAGGLEAQAPSLTDTDIAFRDAQSGRVRRARAGSTRSSALDAPRRSDYFGVTP